MKKNLIILTTLLFTFFLNGCSSNKYDGMSAEEWAIDYYDSEAKYKKFRSCVEDYDNLSFQEKEKYGGIFYYCE